MSDEPSRLALPAPEDISNDSTTLEINSTVKLDKLGPMIVNSDGTLSRIANWQEMSELERQRTFRILLKRNQIRLTSLSAEEEQALKVAQEKEKTEETDK